ncbi:hypothetical protein ILFOPFJJ_03691 [Ensifer psoraleae]|nr:hypothetical protein [Sinorhizobium psoraleae]
MRVNKVYMCATQQAGNEAEPGPACDAERGVGATSTHLKDPHMKNLVTRLFRNESGATAIEYSLIAGLIAVALITGATTLGGKIDTMFTTISGKL